VLWWFVLLCLFGSSEGLDPARWWTGVAIGGVVGLWTCRVGVGAAPDGLTVVGMFRTRRIPAASIRSLRVVRTRFAWHKVIGLQVVLTDGEVVMLRWESWGTQLEALMTIAPPPLPHPSQQRVLDKLNSALDPGRPTPAGS
jgi:hypothetical protein